LSLKKHLVTVEYWSLIRGFNWTRPNRLQTIPNFVIILILSLI